MKRWIAHFSLALFAQPPFPGPSVSSFLSFDESFEFSLDDGCHYSANIKGTMVPVVSGHDAGQKVEPDLTISASLVCPQMEKRHIDQRLSHTGPITREQAETMISHYATMTSENAERRCTYVPTIHFVGEGIVGVGVYATCTRSPS